MAIKNGRNVGGRPTKYKVEYCEAIIKYFDVDFTKTVDGKQSAIPLNFLSAFGRSIGVCHDTLCEWNKVHPDFAEAYKKAKEIQKEHLITCGLLGLFSAPAFIFTAKNIAGMRDKHEYEADIRVDGLDILLKEISERGSTLPQLERESDEPPLADG